MQERIQIIDSFRSVFAAQGKSVDKRRRYLLINILASGFILLVAFFASTASLFSEIFGQGGWSWEDESMGLIVLLSLGSLLRWNPVFFEWRLLRHRELLLNHSAAQGFSSENQELKDWIARQNNWTKNKLNKGILLLSMSILMVLSIWQIFSEGNNPVWTYLREPVVFLYLFALLYFLRSYTALQRNLQAVESRID